MIKSVLPNALTLGNMAMGILAIRAVFQSDFYLAFGLLLVALLLDFADGLVARALGVHSELGKQLDSLADVVSFGVLPGFLLFDLFQQAQYGQEPFPAWLGFLAFLVPLFSALRLGKFNIDTRQSDHFIGLPTPANALLIFSIALLVDQSDAGLQSVLLHPFFLTALSIGCSVLLVAELPLIALKFKSFSWRPNAGRYLLLLGCVLLFVFLRGRALAFVIPLYLLLSLIFKPNKS